MLNPPPFTRAGKTGITVSVTFNQRRLKCKLYDISWRHGMDGHPVCVLLCFIILNAGPRFCSCINSCSFASFHTVH